MRTPHDTIVTYDGRQMMVSEALRQMMNGGDGRLHRNPHDDTATPANGRVGWTAAVRIGVRQGLRMRLCF
jgi:hypothetical protein